MELRTSGRLLMACMKFVFMGECCRHDFWLSAPVFRNQMRTCAWGLADGLPQRRGDPPVVFPIRAPSR